MMLGGVSFHIGIGTVLSGEEASTMVFFRAVVVWYVDHLIV